METRQETQERGLPLGATRTMALLAWSSFFTPLLAGEFSFGLFLFQSLIALPLFLPIDPTRLRGHPVWRIVSIMALLLFAVMWRFTHHRELAVFVLILFCLAYEYYGERRVNAPIRLVSMLSFLVVLSQFRYENGLRLAGGSLIYFVAFVYMLINLHLGRLEQVDFQQALKARFPKAVVHAAGVTLLALMIFWTLPRLPHHSFGVTPSVRGSSIRAFSNRVTLTDIGTLKRSRKHVLNVTPLDTNWLHNPYLKGKILDLYEVDRLGSAGWRLSSDDRDLRYTRDGSYDFSSGQTPPEVNRYRIDVKPLIGNTIFYFDHLHAIDTKIKHMYMAKDMGGLHFPQLLPSSLSYVVQASPISRPITRLREDPYLQTLPDQTYLDDILLQLGINGSMPVNERVGRLLDFFDREFTYTLEINNYGKSDPIHHFLVEQRQGHCELFASSMVLLLRRCGLPARFVTGFLITDKHPNDDFYYVTESSAHAWVEVFIDNSWQTIDPTPASDPLEPNYLAYRLAVVERYWNDFILNWDYEEQLAFFSGTLQKAAQAVRLANQHKKPITLIIIGLSAILALWMGHRRRQPKARVHRSFAQLQSLLKRQWRSRKGSETWQEYLSKAPFNPAIKIQVERFLTRYWAAEYGRQGGHDLKEPLLQIKRLFKGQNAMGEPS